jgi:uncharacterized membrane protein (UPF0127 family)
MRIKNISKNTTIADEAVIADTLKKQTFGLLLYKSPRAMVFRTRFGIHTFFMKYPIDVAVLDKDKKVRKIKKNLQPNRIFLWNPDFEIVFELPTGTLERTKTMMLDTVSF